MPFTPVNQGSDFLLGGGELGRLVRAYDWSSTSLGPVESWLQSLRTTVAICLACRFPVAIFWNTAYVMVYNDAYGDVLGDRHPSALGKSAREVWAETWPIIGPILERAMTVGQATLSDDPRLIAQQQGHPEERSYSFSFSPVRVEGGQIAGVFTTVSETTAPVHREVMETLKKRETQLKQAQRLAQLGSWEWDIATDTVTWSEELYRIFGADPEAFGETYADVMALVHPDDRREIEDAVQRTVRKHKPYVIDHRITRPDGTTRILQSRGEVIVNDAGDVVSMLGTGQDITERKQAEMERERLLADLEESRRLFQRMVEASPDLLFVYDFDRERITYISQNSEKVIGHTAEQVKALGDLFAVAQWHPDDATALPEHRQRLQRLADSEIYECEYRLLQPDNTYRWLRSRSTVFARDAGGQVRQITGITQDVTERKRVEEALRRAHGELETRVAERTRELEKINTALRVEIVGHATAEKARQVLLQQLVSAQENERRRISRELHDSLGQYLSALHFGLQSLQDPDDLPSRVAERLEGLRALALQLDNAVDRLSFNLRPPALDDFGLEVALRLLAEEWSAMSRIPVDLHLSGLDQRRLPETVETTVYRILQEALTNVLKHAQATRVSVIANCNSKEVRAVVEDDGRGFELVGVIDTVGSGRPLGIRGMEERASLAGGQFEIETAPGAGTTVYLRIPFSSDVGTGGAKIDV